MDKEQKDCLTPGVSKIAKAASKVEVELKWVATAK